MQLVILSVAKDLLSYFHHRLSSRPKHDGFIVARSGETPVFVLLYLFIP
jgi:hypothetical protein